MKLNFLSGGRLKMRKNIYLPDADKSEMVELPVLSTLLRHKQGNVLFDTGCHPSVIEDAPARWGDLARFMPPIMQKGDDLISNFACTGLTPDDVDVVICSHLHPDHCGCNVFFRKATVLVQQRELEAARAQDAVAKGFLAEDFENNENLVALNGEHDVFGDGRIQLIPLPGHTPGLMGALVTLEKDGPFLLASDAVALRENLDRDIAPRNSWSVEETLKTFATIRAIEKNGATVICGHDDAQWQTLRKGADHYG